jgi:hypothetical protein
MQLAGVGGVGGGFPASTYQIEPPIEAPQGDVLYPPNSSAHQLTCRSAHSQVHAQSTPTG